AGVELSPGLGVRQPVQVPGSHVSVEPAVLEQLEPTLPKRVVHQLAADEVLAAGYAVNDELRSDLPVLECDGRVVEERIRRTRQLPTKVSDQDALPRLQRRTDEQRPVRPLRTDVLRQRRN